MVLDISGIGFFMPIFSFLFVFVVVYAVLAKTKVLGDQRINLIVAFIMAIIFINFVSLKLYVETIVPWFIVLLVCLFLVLMIIGFTGKDLFEKMVKPRFAWAVVAILILIFLIAAIRVFNPVFHPDLIITSGGSGPGVVQQIRGIFDTSLGGSILLLVIAAVVAWALTRKS